MTRFGEFTRSTRCALYCQAFLSSWGDRMWHFATGVLLTSMTGVGDNTVVRGSLNLKLAAIYGFCSCLATIVLGSLIGSWIDNARRRRAVLTCLFIQNSSVALSALSICCGLLRRRNLVETNAQLVEDDSLLVFLQAMAIIFAVIADLSSAGMKISVSKDWLVVIYGGDKRKLTLLNASLRRIDLSCRVVSPMVCGLVMNFASLMVAAVTIAGWNLLSMLLECFMLLRIHRMNPALGKPKIALATTRSKFMATLNRRIARPHSDHVSQPQSVPEQVSEVEITHLTSTDDSDTRTPRSNGTMESKDKGNCCFGCVVQTLDDLLGMFRGWHAYFTQPCLLTGVALALLYANAICYDQVTMGFAFSQSMPEILISGIGAAVSLTGIAGTFLFPALRARCGLTLGCVIALLLEFAGLLPCVASIWAVGSPFDPTFVPPLAVFNFSNRSASFTVNSSTVSLNDSWFTANFTNNLTDESILSKLLLNQSLILLMAGIVLSRVGLWCADLSISQIYLETVPENERGKVHGAQFSLDKVAEMVKYILVLSLPYPQQFGFLILISVAFVAFSILCAVVYTFRNKQRMLIELREAKTKRSAPIVPTEPDAQTTNEKFEEQTEFAEQFEDCSEKLPASVASVSVG